MDLPVNLTTNLNVVEHVQEINWSVWKWSDFQLQSGLDNQQDQQLATIAAVRHLRDRNAHVYWDVSKQQVLLFDLLFSQRPKKQIDVFQEIFALHGFSSEQSEVALLFKSLLTCLEISRGTLKAADMQFADPKGAKLEDHVSSSTLFEQILPSGGQWSEVADIYEESMSAISSTISHHLAKVDNVMLLGNSVCTNIIRTDDEPVQEDSPNLSGDKTDVIKIDSIWDATGRLIVLSNLSQLPRLCTGAYHDFIASNTLKLGTPMLLSPSGTHVIYRGILSSAAGSKNFQTVNSLKIRCTTHLIQQGLFVSSDHDWALVEVPQTQMLPSTQTLLTVWPAEHLLCKDTSLTKQYQFLEMSGHSETTDPVSRAESWYLGKAARANEVEAARKEAELKMQQQQPQKEESDEDVPSVTASPPFRDIIPQDVSGIYPTPPDGLLSYLSETPASNVQQEASPDFTLERTAASHDHPGYSGPSNEDLFGDMDMDMVGEADFNFFDEPGIGSEENESILQGVHSENDVMEERIGGVSPGVHGELSLEHGDASQSQQAKTVLNDEFTAVGVDVDVGDPVSMANSRETTNESDVFDDGHARPSMKRSMLTNEDQEPEEDLSRQSLQDLSKSDENIKSGRGCFNSMSSATLDIDSKYGDNGRFGYPSGLFQKFDLSLLRKKDDYHVIPRIGLVEDGTSSTGSEDANDEEVEEEEGGGKKEANHIENEGEGEKYEEDDDDGIVDNHSTQFFEHDADDNFRSTIETILHQLTRAAERSIFRPVIPDSPDSVFSKGYPDSSLELGFPPSTFFNLTKMQVSENQNLWKSSSREALYSSDEQSFIQVAQLVADQVARENPSFSVPLGSPTKSIRKSLVGSSHYELLTSIVSGIFPSVKSRSLSEIIDLNDEESHTDNAVFKLDASPVGIQRMGDMTDILPSATPFWEGLGLCPSSGPKDVNAFFIFPKIDYLVQPTKTFLEMIKGAYQTCNLGRHILDGPHSAYPYGLIPELTSTDDTKASFAKFGRHLAGLRLCGGNFIIYMLNTSKDGSAIPRLCNAFLNLFWSYRLALDNEDLKNPNDLVLQIVPSNMIFKRERLVVPSPADYKRLALQVYDRCGPNRGDGQDSVLPFICAPAIHLSKPIPKAIDFKLTTDSSLSLLDTADCLHLAYKWEAGQQWLTASWTNSLGTLQWNTAYWLSKDENIQTAFVQAALAMLEITMEMFRPHRAFNKIYIASEGSFEAHEIATWTRLRLEKALPIDITLIKINSNPSLELYLPRIPDTVSELPEFFATPASTPHTSGHSPEVSGQPGSSSNIGAQGALSGTSAENDADARLIDITDETWAAIVDSTKIYTTADSVEAKGKLQGYLIKRAGTQHQHGLLLFQVNIVHGPEPQNQKPLMKEILTMYRNLALLARVRNIVDPVSGILPIHVAAAGKAHAALCNSMRYAG